MRLEIRGDPGIAKGKSDMRGRYGLHII